MAARFRIRRFSSFLKDFSNCAWWGTGNLLLWIIVIVLFFRKNLTYDIHSDLSNNNFHKISPNFFSNDFFPPSSVSRTGDDLTAFLSKESKAKKLLSKRFSQVM